MIDSSYNAQASALLRKLEDRLGARYFTGDSEPMGGITPGGQLFVKAGDLVFITDEASGEPVAIRTLDQGGTTVGWVRPEGCITWGYLPTDALSVSMN